MMVWRLWGVGFINYVKNPAINQVFAFEFKYLMFIL
jgi:hypothetical protein